MRCTSLFAVLSFAGYSLHWSVRHYWPSHPSTSTFHWLSFIQHSPAPSSVSLDASFWYLLAFMAPTCPVLMHFCALPLHVTSFPLLTSSRWDPIYLTCFITYLLSFILLFWISNLQPIGPIMFYVPNALFLFNIIEITYLLSICTIPATIPNIYLFIQHVFIECLLCAENIDRGK